MILKITIENKETNTTTEKFMELETKKFYGGIVGQARLQDPSIPEDALMTVVSF